MSGGTGPGTPHDPVQEVKRELVQMAERIRTLFMTLEETVPPEPFGPATLPVTQIPVDKIRIGFRRRKDIGDLTSLKASIAAHGLLHPIIVRGPVKTPELVCGRRRLEAFRQLGIEKIDAVRVPKMTDDEFRRMELAEGLWQDYRPDEVSPERDAYMNRADAKRAARTAVTP